MQLMGTLTSDVIFSPVVVTKTWYCGSFCAGVLTENNQFLPSCSMYSIGWCSAAVSHIVLYGNPKNRQVRSYTTIPTFLIEIFILLTFLSISSSTWKQV